MSHEDLNASGGSHAHVDGDHSTDKRRLSIHPRIRVQRKSLVGALQAETLKERQARAKDAREMRRVRISPLHKHIMGIVQLHTGLEIPAIEDHLLDSAEMDLFDKFFEKDGSKCLMLFLQDGDAPNHDSGRIVTLPKGTKMQRLFVTNGMEEGLTGQCIFFLRCKTDVVLSQRNIHEEISYGFLDTTGAGKLTVLPGVHKVLSKIYKPAVHSMEDWGALGDTPHGKKSQKNFLDSFDGFMQYVGSAQTNVSGAIQLRDCETVDIDGLDTASDCILAASNPDIVDAFDELVTFWCKDIEQVLAESEQMRKEADDTGPLAELEHWRLLTARFNSIVDQIKSKKCKMVINVLNVAKSKVLKIWKELDCRITDAANEARDNVKYLYTLEKFCEPLYHSDPVGMVDCIPSLINAIRMIHSISRYYNTSERMTSLFIKVTNQMVTACKNYITNDGMCRIWDQPYDELLSKLHAATRLYKEYQKCFHKTKKKIDEIPGARSFDFSEMYIFGKFDAFCKRIDKIVEMLCTIDTYSVLMTSQIEGIEPMANKFQNIYSGVKKKPYDVLDHRKVDFDNDFEDFKKNIFDLQGLNCTLDRRPEASDSSVGPVNSGSDNADGLVFFN